MIMVLGLDEEPVKTVGWSSHRREEASHAHVMADLVPSGSRILAAVPRFSGTRLACVNPS
jgi:hypothetical protein